MLSAQHSPSLSGFPSLVTNPKYSVSTQVGTDRFIPFRSAMNMDANSYSLTNDAENAPNLVSQQQYLGGLSNACFGDESSAQPGSKILAMKRKAPAPRSGYVTGSKVLYTQSHLSRNTAPSRHISSRPVNVLDAPDISNNYYLNILDWSHHNEYIAIALGHTVHLYNPRTCDIHELANFSELGDVPKDFICSVKWANGSDHLAIGLQNGTTQIWDTAAQKQLRTLDGPIGRVGCHAWNGHILSAGSQDASITHYDVTAKNARVSVVQGHEREVCSLRWSHDGTTLASGGNDDRVCIWNGLSDITPKYVLTEHQGAVRAISWCPWQNNLLATGGGATDKHIRFWNTASGSCVNSINTGSQVCSLQWSPNYRELVSSHGFFSKGTSLRVWKYPTMVALADLKGNCNRCIHTCMSPDGTMVCSAGEDETLKFWKIWEPKNRTGKKKLSSRRGHSSNVGAKNPLKSIR